MAPSRRPHVVDELVRQPRWFATLFVVDMWERFSFYGMQAILYLYLVASPADGGLGMGVGTASALYGTYMSLVFMAALPGGWVADRVLGARKATLLGGVLIAAGHYSFAVPAGGFFYAGMVLIVAGTGLVKPSMSAMIGTLYPGRDDRREAAFSFFYVSIQVSALLAPVVTGFLGERVNWHLGFGAAAVGMTMGLLHYVRGLRRFGEVGRSPAHPAAPEERRRVLRHSLVALVVVAAVATALATVAVQSIFALLLAVVITVPFVALRRIARRPGTTTADRSRLRALHLLLLASAVFWGLHAQTGSLFTQFVKESVDRSVGGFLVPASWFQAANPVFLLLLAPVAGWLWLRLGDRLAAPGKVAGAMGFAGLSLLLMSLAHVLAAGGRLVSPLWVVVAYLLQAAGELAIGPIVLSLCAAVAPPGHTGRLIGVSWLFAALGVGVLGQGTRLYGPLPGAVYFLIAGLLAAGIAVAVAVGTPALSRHLAAPVPAGGPAAPAPEPPADVIRSATPPRQPTTFD
ncbi:peptide MFS transporter [Actinoplanes sp. N902-109]|uniref:peptide MFS transporter n=1 Tax=Actinoplanes sp. (strain N902-109) TaxID=649831 RepID=UPI000329389B|nr:peptide MFS transporter [Actinoplanes sp. N902-109]AGL16644.1 peptide transporter [Actinoplanes sp. N902-109]